MGKRRASERLISRARSALRSTSQHATQTRTSNEQRLSKIEEYCHFPLDTLEDEIRVLTIDAIGSTGSSKKDSVNSSGTTKVIYASIAHTPLHEAGTYTALSYTWGNAESTHSLSIKGKNFSITKNLYEALIHLHRAKATRLWIDAICIDQKNISERSLQVQRMADIYRMAEEVIAWIGTHEHDSRSLFEWIKTSQQNSTIPGAKVEVPSMIVGSVTKLAKRPYFSRMWVVQEFAVARRVRIMCGDNTEDPELINELFFNNIEAEDADGIIPVEPFIILKQIRDYHQKGIQLGLLDLMRHTNSLYDNHYHRKVLHIFKSSDFMDQIYGLLGLVHDGRLFVPKPDYNHSMNGLFEYMTRSIITNSKRLDFAFLETGESTMTAEACGSTNPRSYAPTELPSWCPDYVNLLDSPLNAELTSAADFWRKRPDGMIGFRHRYGERISYWGATSGSELKDTDLWRANDRQMHVIGMLVGKIMPCPSFEGDAASWVVPATQEVNATFAGLDQLLFTYSELRTPPLPDAIKALLLTLNHHDVDKLYCCDPDRRNFRNRLIKDRFHDELRWFVLLALKREDLWRPEEVSTARWNRIHMLSHQLTESTNNNYSRFQRRIAAFQANTSAEFVVDVVERFGSFAWVPITTRPGDEIWLLRGCSMPIVLRKKSQIIKTDLDVFVKVGPAVVNGAMRGEMWSDEDLSSIAIA